MSYKPYIKGLDKPWDVNQIIASDNPELLDATAFYVAKEIQGLNNTQLRNIFGTARKIQANWRPGNHSSQRRALILLKPKLAYQSQRIKEVEGLANWLIPAIDAVVRDSESSENSEEIDKRFNYFMDFFEAIVAYHTYHNTQNSRG